MRALWLHVALLAPASAQVAVRGETIHTMAGPPIQSGVVVVQDGKIAAVGPASEVAIPPGVEVLTAKVVTPGLIDAHTVLGLSGYLNQRQDQDQLDRSDPVQPELRAVDAYDARERLIEWVRAFGVTTIHTGHAPGLPVSGQTMIAKTGGATVEAAMLRPLAMVAATLGEETAGRPDQRPEEGERRTRAKIAALLREQLVKAQDYARRRAAEDEAKRPARDLRLEILARVLAREVPLLVTAHRHQDIAAALRLAAEFQLDLVLDGASDAHLLLEQIAAAGVPVLAHPPMMRSDGARENATFELGAKLAAAGIPFAYQSGFESYVPKTRVVLFEAAVSAAHGLGAEAALRAITIDAARILKIDHRVGSLVVGKDGDLALYDGDPLEYTSHCVGVVIDGVVVSRTAR